MIYELPESDVLTYLKYAKQMLPRHTSYPAAPYWQENFPLQTVREALAQLQKNQQPLSLYFHIPYCRQLCFYCACTKEIYPEERQKKNDPRESLLNGLLQEMQSYAQYLQGNTVHQIHLGGGTPTFLSPQQLQRLFQAIRSYFPIAKDAEIAVEIDPRVTTLEHLQIMREAGCNRVSLGVQDFSETVQKAVQRIQPYEMVAKTVQQARDLGFASINFDLIYGLPFQTLDSMKKTLEQTLQLSPDRIAFYRLSLIPELFKWQKSFRREHLPSERENIEIFLSALNMLTQGPYEFIGLDHFAKKDEALTASLQDGTLRRNFQGMTTGKSLPIIGMGPSAVSQVPGLFFWQNKKTSETWHAALASDSFAFEKGLKLSHDDRVRQELIHELYCYGILNGNILNERTGVDIQSYFASEIHSLKALEEDGILKISEEGVALSPVLGRLLVRLVASYFDRYLQEERAVTQSTRFSQLG